MNLLTVVMIFLGVFPLSAALLVTVGQPVTPVARLVKVASLCTLVVWMAVGFILWRVM